MDLETDLKSSLIVGLKAHTWDSIKIESQRQDSVIAALIGTCVLHQYFSWSCQLELLHNDLFKTRDNLNAKNTTYREAGN